MKILLLGEYSSLYKNLKEGLEELGHDVTTASSGDGYRKIPSDINLSSRFPGFFGKLHRKLNPLLSINKFKGFDVVQVINPFIFHHNFFPNKFFYHFLKINNKKIFFSGAGDDAYYWRFGRYRMSYGPFDDFLKYDIKKERSSLMNDRALEFNRYLLGISNGLIPIMYEYQVSYRDESKCLEVVPIPINLTKIKYTENLIKDKIVVFHGLTRYGFKGTRHVEEAFSFLSKKYPEDLELILDGGLPLDEYLEVMSKTNIVIDQLNSYSLGVNGVYALAMGKVVIGGAEPESLRSQNIKSSPVINVKPCAESLINAIEYLLENKESIKGIGKQSRIYAEEVHDYIKIAKSYVEIWEKN